jgi:hypothetical protein
MTLRLRGLTAPPHRRWGLHVEGRVRAVPTGVELEPCEASAEPRALFVNGEARCEDVLVGEVWIAAGQSNMEWRLANTSHAAEDAAAFLRAGIRVFQAPHVALTEPGARMDAGWRAVTPENAPGGSAVAQLFAPALHRELDVPIGVLDLSWGGSACEAWTPLAHLADEPLCGPILERLDAPGERAQHKAAHRSTRSSSRA